MKTQMMIKCKNNKIEISRLWLPEILLNIAMENPNHKWGFIAGKIIYKWENHLYQQIKLPSGYDCYIAMV